MEKNFAEEIIELKKNPELNVWKIKKLYIQNHPGNGFLYKYASCTDFLIDNLKNTRLWTSYIYKLNDLFEMSISIKKSKTAAPDAKLRDQLHEIMKTTSVCSLSESNNNLKMWAHYSNCHTGVCLEYDYFKILRRYTENNLYKVFYSNKEYELSVDQTDEQLLHTCISSICTKSTIWEEEKEWRIIINENSDNEYGNYLNSIRPSKVYFGSRIDKECRNQIIDICKGLNIRYQQMVKKENEVIPVNVECSTVNTLGQWIEKNN